MSMRRELLAERLYAIDTWNENYPVGTAVEVTRDNGKTFIGRTRARADIVGNEAVIWVEGIAGCYLLDRVHPLEGPQA